MTQANVVDISEYQPTTIDFNDLKANGIQAVIVRLGHGTTQDKNAASHLANAKQVGLYVHGYHYYEGVDGEVAWSIKNAQELGLSSGAYYFLDMEGEIDGSWPDIFRSFYRNWLQVGFKTGLYCSLSKYSLFSDKELTSNHVYRWIADWDVDQAPANADAWQFNCSTGLGQYQDKLDKDVDLTGLLIKQTNNPSHITDPNADYDLKPGAFVGFDYSTTSIGGGKMLVASPDGINKIPKLDPKGNFLFNNHDFTMIWDFIKPRTVTKSLHWADVLDKPDLVTQDELQKIELTPGPAGPVGPQGIPGTPGTDGKTSYFHIAYANSADGKDGFYVGGGRNLLTGTQDWQGEWNNLPSWEVDEEKHTGLAVQKRSLGWYGLGQYYDAKPNTTYTFSYYAKASEAANIIDIYTLATEDWNSPVVSRPVYTNRAITTDWQRYSITFTTKSSGTICPNVCSNKDGITVYVAGYMLEEGTVAHPWSPAPSEAHPIYMGAYTDFTQADSLDPTDYQWSQIKGDKGDRGPQGPPGQDATITIDSSSQTTSKKPSEYPEGIFHEVKDVSTLGIDRSHIAPELQQGHYALVTTKKYSGYARQVAEVLDSSTPATFVRNGEDSTWYDWLISQLTAY